MREFLLAEENLDLESLVWLAKLGCRSCCPKIVAQFHVALESPNLLDERFDHEESHWLHAAVYAGCRDVVPAMVERARRLESADDVERDLATVLYWLARLSDPRAERLFLRHARRAVAAMPGDLSHAQLAALRGLGYYDSRSSVRLLDRAWRKLERTGPPEVAEYPLDQSWIAVARALHRRGDPRAAALVKTFEHRVTAEVYPQPCSPPRRRGPVTW